MASFDAAPSREQFYARLRTSLPKYVSRLYGGDPANRMQVEGESLTRFRYQFLDALRDVGSDMHSGQNPLLREMLQMVMDVDATDKEKLNLRGAFAKIAGDLHTHICQRLNLERLFELVADTGASDGGRPDLEGTIEEAELMAALRLIVERDGMRLPVVYNGLGYNNLVYIALTLSKMDFDARAEQSGDNAVVFPMLVVEEPEAHLHPALQYKLLKYLRRRIDRNIDEAKSRQVFITTHSTQITSACDLDDIICLTSPISPGGSPGVAYPGKVFDESTEEGRNSKGYIQRFLDATKSSMLFAKSVMFVEGIAEQMILPRLAELAGKPLEESHVALVAVGGSTFKHFLPLFGACAPERRQFALRRRVACLVDLDPTRKEIAKTRSGYKACYPYEIGADVTKYKYHRVSPVINILQESVETATNIHIFTNSKTLEYEIAYFNTRCPLLATGDQIGFSDLREFCGSNDQFSSALDEALDLDTISALESINSDEERIQARFATYYLSCVGNEKGTHALELSHVLRRITETEDTQSIESISKMVI